MLLINNQSVEVVNESHLMLERNAYSALANRRGGKTSESYAFISTKTIVDTLENRGWKLAAANEAKVRKEGRRGFQRHVLRFRNPLFKINPLNPDDASLPEIVVVNSHDGTSALKIMFGIFRIACANGLIMGSSLDTLRVVHSTNTVKSLDIRIEEMVARLPELIKRVETFTALQLTEEKRINLAKEVFKLRLKDTKDVVSFDIASALSPIRGQDVQNNAFTIFNRLQEKTIKGGLQFIQKKDDGYVSRKTRAISSANTSTRMNTALWALLESEVA